MAFFSRLFRYLRDIRVEACNSGAEFEREIKKERQKERKKFCTWCYEPLCFVNSSKRKKKKRSIPSMDPSATGQRQITISVHNAQNGQMDLITF